MGIVTSISVPGDHFELGRSLDRVGDVHVKFERVVPTGDRMFPYMWVYTDDHTRFCQLLQLDPSVETLRLIHHDDNEGLYDITWAEDTDGFLGCLRETDAIVLQAGGCDTVWEFELRFDSQESVSHFQRTCTENDISISVDRVVTKSVVDPPGEKLTPAQRETIELALERGYFDVPRKTTMVDLAEELGVSDQAVSARIRRAMKKLSEQLLLPSPDESPEASQLRQR